MGRFERNRPGAEQCGALSGVEEVEEGIEACAKVKNEVNCVESAALEWLTLFAMASRVKRET